MSTVMLRRAPGIVLQLDLAIPFEALILNQLQRYPATRQAEWLRGLLVQGFLCECRALHWVQATEGSSVAPRATIDAPAARPAISLVNDPPVSGLPARPSTETPDAAEAKGTEPLGFAALRKVIG